MTLTDAAAAVQEATDILNAALNRVLAARSESVAAEMALVHAQRMFDAARNALVDVAQRKVQP